MPNLTPGTWIIRQGVARLQDGSKSVPVWGSVTDPAPGNPTPDQPFVLFFSTVATGDGGQALHGATVTSSIAVWVSDKTGALKPTGIKSVAFSGATGERLEQTAPFAALGDSGTTLVMWEPAVGSHAITALVTPTVGTPVTITATLTRAPAPTPAAMGVHTPTPAGVSTFTTWAGVPVTVGVDFVSIDSWDSITCKLDGSGNNSKLDGWVNSDRRLCLGIAPFPTTGATLWQAAAGEYNTHYTQLAQNLVAKGLTTAIIRPMWEFNGPWFHWGLVEQSTSDQWVQTWRHIVRSMRAVTGGNFEFEWTVANGTSTVDAVQAWPGVDFVDYVGVSAFDQCWAENTYPYSDSNVESADSVQRQKNAADDIFRGERGLGFWANFAAQNAKPLAISEWGCSERTDGRGGKDNPFYVEEMHKFSTTNNVAYQCYFNANSSDSVHVISSTDSKFPRAAAKYKELFGAPPAAGGDNPGTPDAPSNARYTGTLPIKPVADLQAILNSAGSTVGVGRIVELEPAMYVGDVDITPNRTGWLNIVAKKGPGSVQIKGTVHASGLSCNTRFIGVDIVGRGYFNGGENICFWYGWHRNPETLGYNSNYGGPVNVFTLSVKDHAKKVVFAGCRITTTPADLIHIGGGAKTLIEGVDGWDNRDKHSTLIHDWHSDSVQGTNCRNSVKILDSYFCDTGRIQIAQEVTGDDNPARWYMARTWVTGAPNITLTLDRKAKSFDPVLTFGEGVHLAGKMPGTYDSSKLVWQWAAKYGAVNNKGKIVGSYSTAVPPGYDNVSTVLARDVAGNPAAKWRAKWTYNRWQEYFMGPGTWETSEGGNFS